MSVADDPAGRLQQMREKAKELEKAADRTSDPEERERLHDKARRLQSQAEQESSMRTGDIYPMK